MLFYTHLIFGFLIGLLTYKYVGIDKYVYFSLVLFGALVPDIDSFNSFINQKLKLTKILGFVFKHRGVFHSLVIPFILFLVIYFFYGFDYGAALLIGYLSHLLIDSLNYAGINYFYPISKLKISGFMKTGGFLEMFLNIVLIMVVVVILF